MTFERSLIILSCFSINNLQSSANGESIVLVTFFVFAFNVMNTLFVYCYVGECLIEEVMQIISSYEKKDWDINGMY